MGTHAERVAISERGQPRGPGRVRARQPPEGDRRDRRRPFRGRDRAGHDPREGPGDGRQRRRGPAPRHVTRGARAAQARVRRCPIGEDRGTARRWARSPPATRPGITDGAAATVVASERAVERHGLTPLARIVGYAQAEVAPKWLFLAPVEGVRRLLDRIELPIEAFDLDRDQRGVRRADAGRRPRARLRLGQGQRQRRRDRPRPPDRRESGARIVATLLHELRRREGRYGLATLCLGGGGSVAMAFERV